MAVLAAAALILALIFAYRIMRGLEIHADGNADLDGQTPGYSEEVGRPMVALQGNWYELKENVETVLLIGIDKFSMQVEQTSAYRSDQQSDFLLLLVLDHDKRVCTPLHINRDTMAPIHMLGLSGEDVGTFEGQLALAHTYGEGRALAAENTVRSVSEFLYGTQIDHYVSFTMDAVPVFNDAVGGVTVDVRDDFSAVDPTITQGQMTLKGEQALTFVRSRGEMEDSSNLARMERQRQYVTAAYRQARTYAADHSRRAELVMQVSPYIASDCTVQQLAELSDAMSGYELAETRTIAGEARLGEQFMEFYPDESDLARQLVDLLYEPVED